MNLHSLLIIGASNIVLAAAVGGMAWAIARKSRRPALAHALYLLALIKLVTPPLLDLPILPNHDFVTAVATLPTIPVGLVPTATPLDRALPSSSAEPIGISWQVWIGALWFMGSLVMLYFAAYRWWRLDRWIAQMLPASEVVQAEIKRLSGRFGLRRPPQAWVIDAAISPMACPGRHGVCLVLPARLLATLSPHERETMLAHELAHIRRRDHWVRVLELLVLSVWWWLPLAWLLRRGLRRAEELCCDTAVLSILPGREIPYSSVLVATARLLVRSQPPLPAHVCGLGPIGQLEERILMINTHDTGTNSRHRGRWLAAVTAFAILPFAACKEPTGERSTGAGPAAEQLGAIQAARDSAATRLSAHVVGAVAEPIRLDVVPGISNMLDALVSSRLTENADLSHAVLIRVDGAESSTKQVDYRKMMLKGDTSSNFLLQAGDIIYIPTKPHAAGTGSALIDKIIIEKGDLVSCLVPAEVLQRSGGEQLRLLTQPQTIGTSGTIFVPYAGSTPVVGLTTEEASVVVNKTLMKYFASPLEIQVRASHGPSAK